MALIVVYASGGVLFASSLVTHRCDRDMGLFADEVDDRVLRGTATTAPSSGEWADDVSCSASEDKDFSFRLLFFALACFLAPGSFFSLLTLLFRIHGFPILILMFRTACRY
jgi:hypothetical protein